MKHYKLEKTAGYLRETGKVEFTAVLDVKKDLQLLKGLVRSDALFSSRVIPLPRMVLVP